MNYVWVIRPTELFNNVGKTGLCITNCKKLKFADELFANKNGCVQKRKTKDFMGLVLKTGKKLSTIEHFKLTDKLKKKVTKDLLIGKTSVFILDNRL